MFAGFWIFAVDIHPQTDFEQANDCWVATKVLHFYGDLQQKG